METFNSTNENNSSWSEETTSSNITEGPTISSPPGGHISVQVIIISTILMACAAFGALSNFFLLLSYKFEKKLQSNFQILVRNQAAADFIICAIPVTLYTVYILMGHWPFGRVLCGLTLVLDYGGLTASTYALVAICVDRLWATKWCHHYRKHNTRKKVTIVCSIVWLSTASIVGYPIISHQVLVRREYCAFLAPDNLAFSHAFATLVIYIPCVFVSACYAVVVYEIRKLVKVGPGDKQAAKTRTKVAANHPARRRVGPSGKIVESQKVGREQIGIEENAQGNEEPIAETSREGNTSKSTNSTGTNTGDTKDAGGKKSDEKPGIAGTIGTAKGETPATQGKQKGQGQQPPNSKKSRKSYITLSYIVVTYILCWFPQCILNYIIMANPHIVPDDAYFWLYWLPYLNSGLNPVAYALSSADFRSTVVKMLKFHYCKSPW